MVPPDRLTVVSPATGANVPPQLLTMPGVGSTSVPDGNVSLNASPVNPTVRFGFVIVKVSCEKVPPTNMLVGANALLIVGGATTVIDALELLVNTPVVVD